MTLSTSFVFWGIFLEKWSRSLSDITYRIGSLLLLASKHSFISAVQYSAVHWGRDDPDDGNGDDGDDGWDAGGCRGLHLASGRNTATFADSDFQWAVRRQEKRRSHSLSYSHAHTLTHTLTHCLYLGFTHTHTLYHTPSCILISFANSLTDSLTHSLVAWYQTYVRVQRGSWTSS